MTSTTCVACSSTRKHDTDRNGLLLRCGRCRFGWTANELAPVDDLYQDSYFRGEGYADYYDPAARRFESAKRLRWLLRAARPGRLWEAGCAAGFFLAAASEAGIDARGVEVSADAVRYATDVLGVPAVRGRFEVTAPPAPVDAVCAFHVLEHVEDPVAFLDAARGYLRPGGKLFLEVPNLASAASRRLGEAWPHLQPQFHRWHFTPMSLSALVRRCGFRVERRDTVFSRFYWRPADRWRHPRELLLADAWASGSLRARHPSLGDAIRLVAGRDAGSVIPAGRPSPDEEQPT